MKDFVHRISHIFDRAHTFFSCAHGGSESCTHPKTPSVHICTHLVHIKNRRRRWRRAQVGAVADAGAGGAPSPLPAAASANVVATNVAVWSNVTVGKM